MSKYSLVVKTGSHSTIVEVTKWVLSFSVILYLLLIL